MVKYQTSGQGYQALFDTIAVQVYGFPIGRCGFTEEDCAAFFLFFRERIPKLIETYRFEGRPFEAYLHTCLRFQLRSYAAQRSRERRRFQLCNSQARWSELLDHSRRAAGITGFHAEADSDGYWEQYPTDTSARERPQPIAPGKRRSLSPVIRRMQRAIGAGTRANATVVGRRLLILALKGCMYLDEGQLETLAQETGHDFDWLRSVYHRLRAHMGRHVARLARLREKRNRALFRAETLEYLLALEPDRQRALRLQRDLAEARDRLETVREAIARVPRTPTNLEISEATGIPKGSIDSILWKLRNRVTSSAARAKARSRT